MVLILALLAAFRATAATGAAGPATLLADGWRQYKDRFVTSEGRVVDNANGGISHSEGQGYAMLIAERLDDRPTFEAIWRWTQGNLLIRGDGLAAWRWSPQVLHVADHNNASDGDLLIAWALAEASDRWHVSEYRKSARQIVEAWRRMSSYPAASGRFCCRPRRALPAAISLTHPSSISLIGSFPRSGTCAPCPMRSIGMRSLRRARL